MPPGMAATRFRSSVLPSARTFQPEVQLLASSGMMSTAALRLIASLRAKMSEPNASEAAPLTRVPAIMSRIDGAARLTRIAMMAITLSTSMIVKPAARFMARLPALVDPADDAGLGAGAGAGQHAVEDLARALRSADHAESGRRPGVDRDGDLVRRALAGLVGVDSAAVALRGRIQATDADHVGVFACGEHVLLLAAGDAEHQRLGVGALAAAHVLLVAGPRNAGEDGDDRDHDHQF